MSRRGRSFNQDAVLVAHRGCQGLGVYHTLPACRVYHSSWDRCPRTTLPVVSIQALCGLLCGTTPDMVWVTVSRASTGLAVCQTEAGTSRCATFLRVCPPSPVCHQPISPGDNSGLFWVAGRTVTPSQKKWHLAPESRA